ncbi:VIT domain-containing protein [Actinoplanes sp. NPDC026623]|uniref:VIT domain-containing protein n=1 Tax=Actinoplanes sp. NPDC026623 TaxID=3155610 RepID=UPI0033C80BCC
MTLSVTPMDPVEIDRIRILPDAGVGSLRTDRGNLPLDRLDVQASISGLVARTTVTTEFVNAFDTALEATYIFPLPDRAAVTAMTMTADGRTVAADLQERAAAREAYDRAIESGRRASIAEQERPDVFTMRVGNILPGERVTVELVLVGPLPWEDGAATFRFPLVVAPRYVPGTPLPGPAVGSGRAADTDAVPDASRITAPVLLPGFPNPLRLSVGVDIDPAGLPLGEIRSSLHTVTREGTRIEIAPGERADRDFILRLPYAGDGSGAVCVPDGGAEGTYQLVLVAPDDDAATAREKDVVLLLDRSGSMGGWKMVAARRAAARVVDTLTAGDRFAVLTFDNRVDRPADLGEGLSHASDRHRFRAVEHLSRADARGGTELLAPLREGLTLLAGAGDRDRVLVLVTDGQVGNEDQILAEITPLIGGTRVHTVGIDRAVNAGFLGRLAALGAGRCELVESEDRLDEAMEQIHRRIAAPVLTDVTITGEGFTVEPAAPRTVFPGVPLVVFGRYTGAAGRALTVRGRTRTDQDFVREVPVHLGAEPAVTAQWARACLRDLEDRYAAGERDLEQRIVATSLRYGVLCRFTAFVAVDSRVVNEGGETRRATQPVEAPSGWDMFSAPTISPAAMPMGIAAAAPMAPPAPGSAAFAPMRKPARTGPAPFAAMPASLQASGRLGRAAAPAGAALTVAGLRAIVEVEAARLRDAETRSAFERRDLLADLASRLGALLEDMTGDELKGLRALIERLRAGGGLEEKWAAAREALEAFAPPPPPARKAFWKR